MSKRVTTPCNWIQGDILLTLSSGIPPTHSFIPLSPLYSPLLPSSLEDRFPLPVTHVKGIEKVEVILLMCYTCPNISNETFATLRQTVSNL